MNRKTIKGIGLAVAGLIVLLLTIYLLLAFYYAKGFSYGTWINGVYCTGKSVSEINDELLKSCSYEGITIYARDGQSYTITGKDISFTFDFEGSLEAYQQKQNPYLWIDNLLAGRKERTILPITTYSENAYYEIVKALPLFTQMKEEQDRIVEIQETTQGYQLLNERELVLDKELAIQKIKTALDNFETSIVLTDAGCYENLPLDAEMAETMALWNKIDDFQNCKIIYQMGDEQRKIDASVVYKWISKDEDGQFLYTDEGNLILDTGKVEDFIKELAEEYDTVGKVRQFSATRGDIVEVEGGIYGNTLNQKAEVAYLTEAFLNKAEEVHVPAYTQMAKKQGKDDIGDTYIEVDMTTQMLYYYEKGVCIIKTPVVTGNTSRKRGTPTGVNYVYLKQKNRVLRGPGYASPVKFWLPVKGGIGIHDSSWRDEYGGEIYKTAGSHGCINTPLEEVTKLYDLVEIGTPVVMFY